MSANSHCFVAWEEHIVCHERGHRVVHFYLKDVSGDKVLAVIGTERSIRHMMYVVSDDFLRAYGSERSINACTKWRARREVVDWLTLLVSKHPLPLDCLNSQTDDLTKALGSLNFSMAGVGSPQTNLPDQMVPRKLRVQSSDIVWSGVAWICAKQLEHFPAFCRNGTTIAVHSFVFIMAEAESHYLGYLEDLYEDKKGQKKVKVRWFHHNQEVMSVISQLNPHPREVFITPHVQVISAECIDGPATVLTPKHYEKCLAVVPHTLSSGVYMCFRQLKNNKVKPFTLTKLRGYSNQAIFSFLSGPLASKQKVKCHKLNGQEEDDFTHEDPVRHDPKRKRSCKEHQRFETSGVTNSTPGSQITKCETAYPKLKFRLSRGPMGIKFVGPQTQTQTQTQPQCPLSFKVDEKIELLCQDSGIRGCWFRCKVLRTSQKHLKVQYDDVQDVEGSGNLEEWVPASRVAAPDKLSMRCPGRLTIRPRPSEDSRCCSFKVGAPVDAWWCDGWWEGVVTQVDISGKDSLQVYFPGEDKFQTLRKNDIRTSRDWVGNTWVDVKARPDIICDISATVSPGMKLPMSSTMGEASECGGSALLDHKVPIASKLEAVEEDKQELHGLLTSDDLLENVKQVNLRKQSCIGDGDGDDKCGGGDGGDDNGNAFKQDKSVLEEESESANQRYEAAEAI